VSPELSECSDSSVSSVSSNGQELHTELLALAERNRCIVPRRAEKKRFKLLRGLMAIQEKIGRKLTNGEVTLAIDEWYRLS